MRRNVAPGPLAHPYVALHVLYIYIYIYIYFFYLFIFIYYTCIYIYIYLSIYLSIYHQIPRALNKQSPTRPMLPQIRQRSPRHAERSGSPWSCERYSREAIRRSWPVRPSVCPTLQSRIPVTGYRSMAMIEVAAKATVKANPRSNGLKRQSHVSASRATACCQQDARLTIQCTCWVVVVLPGLTTQQGFEVRGDLSGRSTNPKP